MKHVIYQGREYVLMREWADRIELADAETGKVLNVRSTEPDEQRRVYEGLYNVERPLTSAFRAYEARSSKDLVSLRERRTRVLLGKPPKAKRASKASKESRAPVDGVVNRQRNRRSSRKSSFIIPEA